MKVNVLVKWSCMVILIVCSFNSYGQSNRPIDGYNELPWGTSVSRFLQLYPGTPGWQQPDNIGFQNFHQANPGGGIKSRDFRFFQDKLYHVIVDYGDIGFQTVNAIIDTLVSRYGNIHSQWVDGSFRNILIRYNANLDIYIRVFRNNLIDMQYINRPLERQYIDARNRVEMEKIEL